MKVTAFLSFLGLSVVWAADDSHRFYRQLQTSPNDNHNRNPNNPFPRFFNVESDDPIEFHEVDWEFENYDQGEESDWGVVRFDMRRLNVIAKDRPNYYINVVRVNDTDSKNSSSTGCEKEAVWLVENLLIQSSCSGDDNFNPNGPRPSASTHLNAYFSLEGVEFPCGPGHHLRDSKKFLEVIVLASLHPVPLTPEMLNLMATYPVTRFPVTLLTDNAEGFLGGNNSTDDDDNDDDNDEDHPVGGVGRPPVPWTCTSLHRRAVDTSRPKPFPGPSNTFVFPQCKFQEDTPNIQCARNQCVPMAVANTLGWLEEKYNSGLFFTWAIPDDLVTPGYGKTRNNITWQAQVEESFDQNLDSLIAQVDKLTRRRNTFDFNSGRGSNRCQMYDGMFGYLNDKGLDAVFRHQGGSSLYGVGGSCQDPDHGSLTSSRQGQDPTWDWIYGQLVQGNGVFLTYGRYNETGSRTGGHVLRVQGACRFGNVDYLYLLDDGRQGSTGNRLTTGLRVTQWRVEDTGGPGNPGAPDGQLNMGDTSWEIEFAQSVQPILNPWILPIQIPIPGDHIPPIGGLRNINRNNVP